MHGDENLNDNFATFEFYLENNISDLRLKGYFETSKSYEL